MKDVPIYARTIRDLCLKWPGRKPKDPTTIHVLGKLSDLMLGRIRMSSMMTHATLCSLFKSIIQIFQTL